MTNPAFPPLVIHYTRTHARVLLVLFALVALALVAITFSPLAEGFADAADRGPGDLDLYGAEVARIHAGENYYDAAATELTARGYPTRSLFNWRTPLPVWLIGQLPEPMVGGVLLVGISLLLVVLGFAVLADEGGLRQGLLGVGLLSGALLPCFLGEPALLSELWSGVLLATSAVLFAREWRIAGVLAGLAAIFFRELAAPYVLVCLALSVSQRRYRELGLWLAGLAAYSVFYFIHAGEVWSRIAPDALAHENGWLRLGGAGFLIATSQMNAYLLLLPQWVTALFLACALLGAATWNSPGGRRIGLTIAAYTLAFAAVGNDFNQYWGCLTAPLLALSAARAPAVLQAAWQASRWGVPASHAASAH